MKIPDSSIERLEDRIAPASIITYVDAEGDTVKITSSKGMLTTGLLSLDGGTTGQLMELDLSNGGFGGAAIAISVLHKAPTSTGLVNVGYIDAIGYDLASVKISGDLARIDAGTNSATVPAIGALTVHTMGAFGLGTHAGSLTSNINGKINTFKVAGDVTDATINVNGSNGGIGTLFLGGSLLGGEADNSGEIQVGDNSNADSIGKITIGRNIVGAAGSASGVLIAYGSIKSAVLGGSVLGGAGTYSGIFEAVKDLGSAVIGGSVVGGPVTSGVVSGIGSIGSILVKGDLIGGNNGGSGAVDQAGEIGASGHIHSVVVKGSVIAGYNTGTGTLTNSGTIYSAMSSIDSITISGSVLGNSTNPVVISGNGFDAKTATGDLAIGQVTIGGDAVRLNLVAGFNDGFDTNADGSIGKILVKGSWRASNAIAGAHQNSAPSWGVGDTLQHANDTSLVAQIGSIIIGGNVEGAAGSAQQFGFVSQQINSLKIGGHAVTLKTGPGNDVFQLALEADVHVEEV